MKKLLLFICVFFSLSVYSQRTGISYQALIIDPNGEQLPGYNNQNSPLVNTAICLEFIILDENNTIEYSEYQSVTTDKYGMVNLTIGTGDYAGGSSGGWNGIVWSEKPKKLRVLLDITGVCSGFVEISNQDLTSVPFALFAPGQEGRDGESAYEIWLSEGNSGTVQQFLESLKGDKGDDGLSAFQVWKELGNSETEQDFIDSLKGDKGDDGLSAFQVWKELGNSETEQDFIDSLKGEKGDEGKSAYQIWLDAGNTGTEEEFLASLKGSDGGDGTSAKQSLIKTTIEAAGDNCANGGIKIETGIDSNSDGVLDDDEVNTSQTKYLCNGSDGADGADGTDGADGADGAGGSQELCREFDLVAVYRSSVGTSDVSHDSGSIASYYPGALNGNASSYISGAGLNLTGLDSYRVVLSSSNESNLPWFGISIKAYDLSGQELTFSVRKEQMWWYDTSYSDQYGQTGGGYKNFNNTSAQQVFFYWKGKTYEENIGAQWTDRGGAGGNGKWHINLEISSNSKIDRLIVDYSPAASAKEGGSLTTSIIKYLCSTVSTNDTSSTPPSDLEIGDYFGGGVVFYIAQSGDEIYVDGEVHGLVAPALFRSGMGNSKNLRTEYANIPGAILNTINSLSSDMYSVGKGGTITKKLMEAFIAQEDPNKTSYNEENWPLYSNPWAVAYFAKINGYNDWYIPNEKEWTLLYNYMVPSPPYPTNNSLGQNLVKGWYMNAGSFNGAIPQRTQVDYNASSYRYFGDYNQASFYIIRAF